MVVSNRRLMVTLLAQPGVSIENAAVTYCTEVRYDGDSK